MSDHTLLILILAAGAFGFDSIFLFAAADHTPDRYAREYLAWRAWMSAVIGTILSVAFVILRIVGSIQ